MRARSIAALRLSEEQPKWEGTFEELLLKLSPTATPQDRDLKSWPKTGRGLSAVLRRIAPNLRRRGVTVKFLGHKKRGSLVQLVRTASVEPAKVDQASAFAAAYQAASQAVVIENLGRKDLTDEEMAAIVSREALAALTRHRKLYPGDGR